MKLADYVSLHEEQNRFMTLNVSAVLFNLSCSSTLITHSFLTPAISVSGNFKPLLRFGGPGRLSE